MNRRGFLGMFAAAAVLDPERLLWVPGRKLISIPKPRAVGYWKLLYQNPLGAGEWFAVWEGPPDTTEWQLTSQARGVRVSEVMCSGNIVKLAYGSPDFPPAPQPAL